MYQSSKRRLWSRQRWSTWLAWTMSKHSVSQRVLAQTLSPEESGSDFRSAVRAWTNGTRSIGPNSAFRVGEALREPAQTNGAIALLIAGHYYDFLLGLQRLLWKAHDPHVDPKSVEWIHYEVSHAVTYVPLIAEVEVLESQGYMITDEVDVAVFNNRTGWNRHGTVIPRNERFLKRSIREARRAMDDLHSGILDVAPLVGWAWETRNEETEFEIDLLRQTYDIIEMVRIAATSPTLGAIAAYRAARALMREWGAIVDYDFAPRIRPEIDALEGLLEDASLEPPRPLSEPAP